MPTPSIQDAIGRRARLLLAALVAALPCSLASAAQTRFHITVLDVAGAPMPDIVAGVLSRGQGSAAVTGANGSAVVTVDVPAGAELAVAWIDAFRQLEGLPGDERSRLSRRALSVASAHPVERLIRLMPGVGDYTIELRYRAGRVVRGVVTEQGNPVARFWQIGTPTSGLASPRTKPDGSFQLIIDPVGSDVMMEMSPDDDIIPGRSIIVRVPAAAIGPNGDMGAIDVNPTIAQTGTVVFHLTATPEQYRQVHAHFAASFWGLALVSADGRTVVNLTSESDLRIPLNEPAILPVGTYYFVPGSSFCWTWTQRRIIEACLNGVDLSQSGIPQVVIAPGANPDVNLDPVAAELAIQQYFLPPN